MDIYTIGFTHKSARQFFESLRQAGIRRLIDVRLKNVSQLAGFTKKDDLSLFPPGNLPGGVSARAAAGSNGGFT